MNKNKKNKSCCERCVECIAIGEGDHICTVEEPKLIIESYSPAEEYYWCKGKHFEER